MKQLSALMKIKNNLMFTVDDIKLMLMIDQEIFEQAERERRAVEIYTILRSVDNAERYNDRTEMTHRDNTDIELIGIIDKTVLIELDESLRKELSEFEYSIYCQMRDNQPTQYICAVNGISRTTLWRWKNRINSIVFRNIIALNETN